MSLKSILSLLGVILISGVVYFSLRPSQPKYSPLIKSRTVPFNSFATAGINDIAVKSKILSVERDDEVATVSVEFTFPFELTAPLQYQWRLGQDVLLIDGTLVGKTENGIIRANEIQKLTIKVRGFSKQRNHHISFEIFGKNLNRPLRSKIIIASNSEDTFENVVQNVERIKKEE